MANQPNADLTLARALKFTESDLEANRSGHMTSAQAETVRARGKDSVMRYRIGVIVLGFFLIVFTVLAMLIGLAGIYFALGAALLIVPMIVIGRSAVRFEAGLTGELQARTVSSAAGTVRHPRYPQEGRYMFYINGSAFKHLTLGEFQAFTKGARYRVYFSPHSRVILSAEADVQSGA